MTRMRSCIACLVLGILVALLASCSPLTSPLTGGIYTNVKAGTDVGNGEAASSKTGTACAKGVLGFAWGDATVDSARSAGGITIIAYVDHSYYSIMSIYSEYCTIVKGE